MTKKQRQEIFNKFGGLCAYTGKPLGEDWQVDHVTPKDISLLLPALRIINHYKRGKDLDLFRKAMITFHVRLKKLPRETSRDKTKKTIEYMHKVAEAFGITIDKPFAGKFYFETITVQCPT